ncbi:hypothetical protein O0I10_006624 [Lichtheimia ornata]|uniref:CCHC-type domain-containing protein n=1 Tax=Lichtheimia ornata TaxID=688661 RepID=A0AAD7V2X2_9FUNG|nr:uncharacterized protein O0I10_006624 [Lichtheimia ornata]KAJ8657809.1 hypothetical protein O0I10_006624 [Lichtheimia ornata]
MGKPPEKPLSFAAAAAAPSKETLTLWGGGLNGFQPWCHADNDNALLFELTNTKISDIAFRSAARQVFSPNDTCGLIIRTTHRRTIAEVVFNSYALREKHIGSKVTLPNGQIIAGHVPIPEHWDIVRVNLSNLPAVQHRKLTTMILHALQPYGHVIEVCIHLEQGWFTGTGYAIINKAADNSPRKPNATKSPPLPLDHTIPITSEKGKETTNMYATWAQMPLYCRYCHASGHSRLSCPSKPSPRCFHCQVLGHIKAMCPYRKESLQQTPKVSFTANAQQSTKRPRVTPSLPPTSTKHEPKSIEPSKSSPPRAPPNVPASPNPALKDHKQPANAMEQDPPPSPATIKPDDLPPSPPIQDDDERMEDT